MNSYIHPRLRPFFELAEMLEQAARATSRSLRQKHHAWTRPRAGATLRPGPGTPLWNELARIAAAQTVRYGEKAKLGRHLGVPRQRVHEYLIAQTACPDTERALLLITWLLTRHESVGTDQPRIPSPNPKPSVT